MTVKQLAREFDDNYSDVDYRMDVNLPFLFESGFAAICFRCNGSVGSGVCRRRLPYH